MNIQVIEEKIQRLREAYKSHPEKRTIIEKQAKMLKIAKEIAMEKQQPMI